MSAGDFEDAVHRLQSFRDDETLRAEIDAEMSESYGSQAPLLLSVDRIVDVMLQRGDGTFDLRGPRTAFG